VAYHARVLSTAALPVPLDTLREALAIAGREAVLVGDDGGYWENVVLARPSGVEIAAIHRRPVNVGDAGAEELAELVEEARAGKPASTARWVEGFLGTVRTIYAIRVLRGADADGGWDAIHTLRGALWRAAEAIFHADAWGFSNTAGDHVLWRFLDFATTAICRSPARRARALAAVRDGSRERGAPRGVPPRPRPRRSPPGRLTLQP
jgi:hypothetical protein